MDIEDVKKKLTDTYNSYINGKDTVHKLRGIEKMAEKQGMSHKDIQKCYVFHSEMRDVEPVKKEISVYSEMGKGRKQCKKCDTIIAARVRVCPKCSWDFKSK